MEKKDVETAVEWAALEGWNPGLNDAASFFEASNNGFLMGELGDEAVSCISAVKYGRRFGFIGFYIVKPEYRGRGLGLEIWKAGMKSLGGRNIGLDGVVEQQENYKKFGFKKAYNNMRYEGETGGDRPENPMIKDLHDIPFEKIDAYDRKFFPEPRSLFLKTWINQPQSRAIAFIENGEIAGMGMIRKCRNGYKIGPLFAENPNIAELIFLDLKAGVESGKPLFLDLPDLNENGLLLAETYRMELCFQTARMYTGAFPILPLDKIFGVTSFELG